MNTIQYIQKPKDNAHAKHGWCTSCVQEAEEIEQYTRQELDEMELRTLEDALERLAEKESNLRALKKITKGINKSSKSSTGYIWRLVNNTPKNVTLVKYHHHVVDSISYLDSIVEAYTTHLANVFSRMIVNKRAVKENIESSDIYVVESDDIRRVFFDLAFTYLDYCVEEENYLAMDGFTEYSKIVNYTTKSGYHAGCSFQEILSDKLRDTFNKVSMFVQNRHKFEDAIFCSVYCELFVVDNRLLIQAVYDESD